MGASPGARDTQPNKWSPDTLTKQVAGWHYQLVPQGDASGGCLGGFSSGPTHGEAPDTAILTPPSGRGCTAAPRPGWTAQWAHHPHPFSAVITGPCHNWAFSDSPRLRGSGHRATRPRSSQQWPPRPVMLTLGVLWVPPSKCRRQHLPSPLHSPPVRGQEVAYLGPGQFGFHMVVVRLHRVCKLQVAQRVLVATEHLLEKVPSGYSAAAGRGGRRAGLGPGSRVWARAGHEGSQRTQH